MLKINNCPSSVAKMMTMAWRATAKIGCRRSAENFMHDGSIDSSFSHISVRSCCMSVTLAFLCSSVSTSLRIDGVPF